MIDSQQKDLQLILEAADQNLWGYLLAQYSIHLYRTLQSRGCGREGITHWLRCWST